MDREQDRLFHLLEEIRDNQRQLLDQNRQMMALSKDQFDLAKHRQERTERIQDRAEALQSRSEGLVGGARKALFVTIPVLIALLIYVSWLLFGLIL